MKQIWIQFLATVMILALPGIVLAADEPKVYDARLESYPSNVTLEGGSTGLDWVLVAAMAAVCIGVMFMNAKRSHLD